MEAQLKKIQQMLEKQCQLNIELQNQNQDLRKTTILLNIKQTELRQQQLNNSLKNNDTSKQISPITWLFLYIVKYVLQ